MSELAEVRRVTPTDDLTSALVNTNIEGESLSPRRDRLLLHPFGGGRERHHPQCHQPRPAGPCRAPRPAGPLAGRPGRHRCHRRRRDRALGLAHHLDAPHGGASAPCSAARSCSPATSCSCSTTRPTATRTSSRTPTRFDVAAHPQPTLRLRGRRAALLPGRPSGPPGDRRVVPSALRAPARHRRPSASPTGCARPSSTGSSTSIASSPPAGRCRTLTPRARGVVARPAASPAGRRPARWTRGRGHHDGMGAEPLRHPLGLGVQPQIGGDTPSEDAAHHEVDGAQVGRADTGSPRTGPTRGAPL